ncbi:LysR family transcriptional regulator [Hornefia porci]|uniref:LysR family transcriptional regulator n=1 Tax=Hornefia porci TaxID=2652292 RepID=A0A1Q9JHR0_9FIRM|nr:LysR family transcriptional regulator [Hornefia porci]OLR55762.1 LysR family transcriptional regulator [Hornefia porci]
MLDYRFQTFLTVCETLNYTRAAAKLGLTQPAVSRHIRSLEEEYGVPLFVHKNKRISLSPAGTLLMRHARTIRSDGELLRQQLKDTDAQVRELRMGTTKTIADFVIGRPMVRFLRRNPELSLHLSAANTTELLERIRQGTLDVALVEGHFDSREFDSCRYSTEDFIAVTSAKHAFAHEPLKLREVLNEPLLIREPGSGTRDILEKNLAAAELNIGDFSRCVEIGSMHIILQLLEADMGISFMYRAAAAEALSRGSLRELRLRDFRVRHDFSFVWNKGSLFADTFREICLELRG